MKRNDQWWNWRKINKSRNWLGKKKELKEWESNLIKKN
jgi:hypothetical protein